MFIRSRIATSLFFFQNRLRERQTLGSQTNINGSTKWNDAEKSAAARSWPGSGGSFYRALLIPLGYRFVLLAPLRKRDRTRELERGIVPAFFDCYALASRRLLSLS